MNGCSRDRGSVTAEFVVALPAVVLLLTSLVWSLGLAAAQVRLQDEAGLAARAAARGETGDLGEAGDLGVVEYTGRLVCVTRSRSVPPLTLTARACALP